MPRTPEPQSPLDAAQQTALDDFEAAASAAQALRVGRYVQVRRGVAGDFTAAGLSAPATDTWIDEYLGPGGKGFEIHTVAGGKHRVLHHGPEAHRDGRESWPAGAMA